MLIHFKNSSIAFLTCIGIIGLLSFFFGINLLWIIPPTLVYLAFIIYGSATIQSDFFLKAFCNSNTSEKEIAITFDDGPNKEFTSKILSTLAEFNAPATFFVIGKNIQGNQNLIKQIDSAGHVIGNHTFSHSFFIDFKSTIGFLFELNLTSDLVYETIGKRMKLFRPPFGVTTPNIANAVKALNYLMIGWSIRSLDTKNDSEEKIISRVIGQIKPGDIVLFHDTSEKTDNVLRQTLNFAKKNGFKIVGIEQLLNIKAYE